MSLRTWSYRACTVALITLLVGCGGSTATGGAPAASGGNGINGNPSGSSGGSSPPPQVSGVSTPKSVSVVTAN